MTFSNYGSNYTITYPNPYPSSIVTSPGINVTQNFGIQPPAPTCTGGVVTATPAQIYVGGNPLPATSSLNIAGCVTGGGAPGAVTYTWTPATQGTITQVNAATTTYTPPAAGATYTQVDIAPSVSVCNPGGVGATCKPYGGSLILIPTFTVSPGAMLGTFGLAFRPVSSVIFISTRLLLTWLYTLFVKIITIY